MSGNQDKRRQIAGPDGSTFNFDKRSSLYLPTYRVYPRDNTRPPYFRDVEVRRDWWPFAITTIISLATFVLICVYTKAAQDQVDASQAANYNFMKSSRAGSNEVAKQLDQLTKQAGDTHTLAKNSKDQAA